MTVGTDDPVFFKTTLLDEFWALHTKLNFTLDEIKVLIKNSFKSSFLSESEKNEWLKKVDAAFEN